MKKKIVLTAVVSVFLLSAMPWTQLITSVGGFPKMIHVAGLTPHDSILIEGNADFTAVNGVTGGSGTAKDPYVIEGWEINGGESDCIHIKDTNAFFVIRNVLVHNGQFGIIFEKVTNGAINNSKITDNFVGIRLSYSSKNTITSNDASNNFVSIVLDTSSNNTIIGNSATFNHMRGRGILLINSSNNTVSSNEASNNGCSIFLHKGSNNIISGNNATSNNVYGIRLYESSNNTISGNNASNNVYGIKLRASHNNTVYHNNFINNKHSTLDDRANRWDNGYPSGGNYWSNYNGVDADGDGIGDTPHVINAKNQDRFPLMGPFGVFEAGTWDGVTYRVEVVSNSTVSDFDFSPDDKAISFNVTGPDRTMGFCRVTISNTLLGGPYDVLVNGSPPLTLNEQFSGNNTFIHFTYRQSTKRVEIVGTTTIIPKSPSVIIPPHTFIVIILVATISKRGEFRRKKISR